MTDDQDMRSRLAQILGPSLEQFVDLVPDMMAREIVADDPGFITRFQLSESLLSRLTPEMKSWPSPDVLRHLLPASPLSKTRMQPIAGSVAAIQSAQYPQFSYYPYIPVAHQLERRTDASLIVLVHGSSRNPRAYRDEFAEFAEARGCFLLAPLFPMNLADPVPDEQYKYLVGEQLRYDIALLSMIDEFSAITGTSFSEVLMFGFSGGAQFAHRFFYVHPGALSGLSIGSPGFITLTTTEHDWWLGLRNLKALFGVELDEEAMRCVPVQLICGADDNIDYEIYSRQELGMDAPAYRGYGKNRIQRINALRRAYDEIGVSSELALVPQAKHELMPIAKAAKPFFDRCLAQSQVGRTRAERGAVRG